MLGDSVEMTYRPGLILPATSILSKHLFKLPEPVAAEQGDVGFIVSTVVFIVLNVVLGVAIEPVVNMIELGLRLL